MFYIAKAAQAAGLAIILFAFLKYFPHLMGYKVLIAGIGVFGFGWCVDQFLLKH